MSLPAVDKLGAVFRGADLEASLSMLAVNMAAKVRLWQSCVSNVPPVLITGHLAYLLCRSQLPACNHSLLYGCQIRRFHVPSIRLVSGEASGAMCDADTCILCRFQMAPLQRPRRWHQRR